MQLFQEFGLYWRNSSPKRNNTFCVQPDINETVGSHFVWTWTVFLEIFSILTWSVCGKVHICHNALDALEVRMVIIHTLIEVDARSPLGIVRLWYLISHWSKSKYYPPCISENEGFLSSPLGFFLSQYLASLIFSSGSGKNKWSLNLHRPEGFNFNRRDLYHLPRRKPPPPLLSSP